MDEINLRIVRDSYGRVVYSHKTHEKAAEIQGKWSRDVKIINIVLLVFTAGSILGNLITNQSTLLFISSVMSGLALGFSLLQLTFSPELSAVSHKRTALELWNIRERYVHLIGDIMSGSLSNQEIVSKRDQLIQELSLIYKLAPGTDSKSYDLAREALKDNEELTFTDREIDLLLPSRLRLSK